MRIAFHLKNVSDCSIHRETYRCVIKSCRFVSQWGGQ